MSYKNITNIVFKGNRVTVHFKDNQSVAIEYGSFGLSRSTLSKHLNEINDRLAICVEQLLPKDIIIRGGKIDELDNVSLVIDDLSINNFQKIYDTYEYAFCTTIAKITYTKNETGKLPLTIVATLSDNSVINLTIGMDINNSVIVYSDVETTNSYINRLIVDLRTIIYYMDNEIQIIKMVVNYINEKYQAQHINNHLDDIASDHINNLIEKIDDDYIKNMVKSADIKFNLIDNSITVVSLTLENGYIIHGTSLNKSSNFNEKDEQLKSLSNAISELQQLQDYISLSPMIENKINYINDEINNLKLFIENGDFKDNNEGFICETQLNAMIIYRDCLEQRKIN